MIKLKFLSAALIAVARVTAPAMAREGHAVSRHFAKGAALNATSGAYNVDKTACQLAPRVGAFATQPWDNGPPCEPASDF